MIFGKIFGFDVIRFSIGRRVMIMIRKTFLILIAFVSISGAQNSDRSPMCWRPRPLASCNAWIVTDAAVETPMSSTAVMPSMARDYGTRVAFTIGVMKNTEPMSAFGAGLSVVNEDLPGRVEARFRHWLDRSTGFDVGIGIVGGHLRPHGSVLTNGVTGSIGLSTTYIGVDARVDYARTSTGERVHASFLTMRTGSRATPIAGAVAGLAILILLSSVNAGS